MKNLFSINESEKERILGMHQEATKKQYLNEVGYYSNWIDVDFTNKTLTLNNYLEMERKGGGSELKLFKGTVFKKESDNTLITDTTYQTVGDYTGSFEEEGTGKVKYYCSSKEFEIVGRNAKFWGEDFASDTQKGFDDLCSELYKSGTVEQPVKTDTTADNFSKFPCVPAHPKAKKSKMLNKSIVYFIGDVVYYSNGRKKLADGTMTYYTCNDKEFKTQTGGKTGGTGYSSRIKPIQKQVGVAESGTMDQATIDAIYNKLKSTPTGPATSTNVVGGEQ